MFRNIFLVAIILIGISLGVNTSRVDFRRNVAAERDVGLSKSNFMKIGPAIVTRVARSTYAQVSAVIEGPPGPPGPPGPYQKRDGLIHTVFKIAAFPFKLSLRIMGDILTLKLHMIAFFVKLTMGMIHFVENIILKMIDITTSFKLFDVKIIAAIVTVEAKIVAAFVKVFLDIHGVITDVMFKIIKIYLDILTKILIVIIDMAIFWLDKLAMVIELVQKFLGRFKILRYSYESAMKVKDAFINQVIVKNINDTVLPLIMEILTRDKILNKVITFGLNFLQMGFGISI